MKRLVELVAIVVAVVVICFLIIYQLEPSQIVVVMETTSSAQEVEDQVSEALPREDPQDDSRKSNQPPMELDRSTAEAQASHEKPAKTLPAETTEFPIEKVFEIQGDESRCEAIFEGVVIDDTGQAISGASLEFHVWTFDQRYTDAEILRARAEYTRLWRTGYVARGKSDLSGRFVCRIVFGKRDYEFFRGEVEAVCEYGWKTGTSFLHQEESRCLKIVIPRASALSGQVLSEDGRPLKGIDVAVDGPAFRSATESDSTGRFEFSSLRGRNYRLIVTSVRHQAVEQLIYLEPGDTVDLGEPIVLTTQPHAEIEAYLPEIATDQLPSRVKLEIVISDHSGTVVLSREVDAIRQSGAYHALLSLMGISSGDYVVRGTVVPDWEFVPTQHTTCHVHTSLRVDEENELVLRFRSSGSDKTPVRSGESD